MNEEKRIHTVCPYCGVGCRFYIVVRDGHAVGIEYMTDHPVGNGRLCAKGNASLEVLNHSDRLQYPMRKSNKGWERISWDVALDTVSDRIQTIRSSLTAHSLGFLASAKCTNEENYLFQKMARLLGTNNVDHCARLCHAPTIVGLGSAFGDGAMTNPLSDLAQSECIFIIGSNLAENHSPALIWIWAAKDRGAKIIVADPRQTPTAWLADEFMPIRPGSDVALINGMAQIIIAEGLTDQEFIGKRTSGFTNLAASVKDYMPEKVAALTGLTSGQIVNAARLYGRAKSASIIYCMGITQHTCGSDNVSACANLAMLTGNIGRPGTGVLPLRGQNNVQGACDMGALPDVFPGYRQVADNDFRTRLAEIWKTESLSSEAGLTVVEMMQAARDGHIKGMWIMGEDPINSDPNAKHVHEALASLDFLVVQDIFLTDTARMADLVLPAAAWAEKSGTFTNTERRVQWFDQAVSPKGESRPDLWIINEVGKRLGLFLGVNKAADVLAEISQAVPHYGGVTPARAAELGGVHRPCPTAEHPGTPILHVDGFSTISGKGHFIPVTYRQPAESTNDTYPLVLTTGRFAVHYNAGSMTRRTRALIERAPTNHVEIHPVDARQLGIDIGEYVDVVTARGRFTAKAQINSTIEPGVVFLPFHFPGVNDLTIDALDNEAKIPEFKVAACRVEKGRQR